VDRLAAEASWIDVEEFYSLYPDFWLEDELLEKGGRGEMSCAVCNTPSATASGKQKQGRQRQHRKSGIWNRTAPAWIR
jgi:hypothetical protein